MKRYLNYINENKSWYKNKELTKKELNELLKGDFSDFNPDDKPIYRSVELVQRYTLVKSISDRPSAYIKSNYYTLLINNLPSWSEYPKRQFICSDKPTWFANYMYRVIPKNGAKIGICPDSDIQDFFSEENKLGKELLKDGFRNLSGINIFLKELNIETFSWELFLETLEHKHELVSDLYYENKDKEKQIKYTNINELNRLINPDLGFEVYDYKDYAKNKNIEGKEVWLDSDIILVPQYYFS